MVVADELPARKVFSANYYDTLGGDESPRMAEYAHAESKLAVYFAS